MGRFKNSFNIAFIVIIAILIGIFVGIYFQRNVWFNQLKSKVHQDKLQYTMEMLDQKYVDSLSYDSLTELIIPQLLSTLDPHSEYVPASQAQVFTESLAGKFDGIGVMFNMFTDTAVISNVIAGGPSSKVGVMPGDKIITVNDTIIAGKKMDSNKVVGMLRGKKDSQVKLGLKRGANKELVHITVTRGEIPVRSVDAAFIIKPNIGYIKVSKFAANTYKEFIAALNKLKAQGMQNLVVDLRDNGGGYLEQAIYMANEFLQAGEGIVYTQGAKFPRREQRADGNGHFKDIPMVILMGPESASASEIFAGAMQDNDRATIVGLRSFGKGLIQEQFEYPDGSVARVTIAHYYTPLGRSIQKPYTPGHKQDYQMELLNRYKNSEFLNADSIVHDSTKQVVTPKGRILYGGGGIHPDTFVPIDTTSVAPYFRKLVDGNYIFRFANKYTEDNREKLNEITSFAAFDKLVSDEQLLNQFLVWSNRNGMTMPSDRDLAKSRRYILAQLKGYISRNTQLEENGTIYYFYPIDKTMKAGVETFKEK